MQNLMDNHAEITQNIYPLIFLRINCTPQKSLRDFAQDFSIARSMGECCRIRWGGGGGGGGGADMDPSLHKISRLNTYKVSCSLAVRIIQPSL